MRKLSNTAATKEYVPNTLGNSFTFNNLFASKHFSLIFVSLTSILNTKVKCVLFAVTSTGCFNVKRLFKNNYENASSRIVTFLSGFYLCCNFIKCCKFIK